MTKKRLEFTLKQLESAQELEALQEIIVTFRDHLKVDHLVYHWVNSAGEQYGCGTYSDAWRDRYIAQDYVRLDPVIIGCYRRFHPVDWKRLDWSGKNTRKFQAEAIKYGVGNQGYSIPIRGPAGQFALFSASHNCNDAHWAKFVEENCRDFLLIAHEFNRKALEFEPDRTPDQERHLSPREIDAMTFLAMGYNRAQVADSLAISEHTLRVYIESARAKLGAHNTTHAVARALSRGLIVV